jgi:hypothetical protein
MSDKLNTYTLDTSDSFSTLEDLRHKNIELKNKDENLKNTEFEKNYNKASETLNNTYGADKDSFDIGNKESYPYNRTNIYEDCASDEKENEKNIIKTGNKITDSEIQYRDNEKIKVQNQNFSEKITRENQVSTNNLNVNNLNKNEEVGFYDLDIADYPDRSNLVAIGESRNCEKSLGVDNGQNQRKSQGMFGGFKSIIKKSK